MIVSAINPSPRIERNQYLRQKGIKAYGQGNDYPQKIQDVIGASGTGKSCYDIYTKFIKGAGFADEALGDLVINERGEHLTSLLSKFADDLRKFSGFACLVKYLFTGEASDYYAIPFEHCRLAIDENKEYNDKVAIHPDWTNMTGKRFRYDDVMFINRFNPETVLEEMREAGGPEEYLGQVFYFTADGEWEYPLCPFDPVITDMLTEDSVSTVKHRNAKYNFLPAGVLVRKGKKPVLDDHGRRDLNDPYTKEMEESADEIRTMQGDANACKIWVVDVDADEEKPEFMPFESKNYDQQYQLTEETVQDNIGRMFRIPPILRGVDIGAGFGGQLMQEAYNFMNSVVGDERKMLESAFADLLIPFPGEYSNFEILPIEYVLPKNEQNDSIGNQS